VKGLGWFVEISTQLVFSDTIRFPSEKTNCVNLSGAMSDFSSCTNELELIDPPLFRGSYTGEEGKITGMLLE